MFASNLFRINKTDKNIKKINIKFAYNKRLNTKILILYKIWLREREKSLLSKFYQEHLFQTNRSAGKRTKKIPQDNKSIHERIHASRIFLLLVDSFVSTKLITMKNFWALESLIFLKYINILRKWYLVFDIFNKYTYIVINSDSQNLLCSFGFFNTFLILICIELIVLFFCSRFKKLWIVKVQ